MEVKIDDKVCVLLLKYLDKKKTKDGILISPEAFISLAIMEKLERQQGKH